MLLQGYQNGIGMIFEWNLVLKLYCNGIRMLLGLYWNGIGMLLKQEEKFIALWIL